MIARIVQQQYRHGEADDDYYQQPARCATEQTRRSRRKQTTNRQHPQEWRPEWFLQPVPVFADRNCFGCSLVLSASRRHSAPVLNHWHHDDKPLESSGLKQSNGSFGARSWVTSPTC